MKDSTYKIVIACLSAFSVLVVLFAMAVIQSARAVNLHELDKGSSSFIPEEIRMTLRNNSSELSIGDPKVQEELFTAPDGSAIRMQSRIPCT